MNKEKVDIEKNVKRGLGFRLFKAYMYFFHNYLYYRKVQWIGTENIPDDGSLMVVSDHQNCMSDALALVLSIPNRKKRKHKIFARADAFNSRFQKAMEWLGIMPAYRMEFDGAETIKNNWDFFAYASNELLCDGTVFIYPEAGHQDKRWLGKFSSGYLRILFQAAEKSNFEKELFVMPCCNHYSDYFHAQEKMLVKYGKPIPVAPYYELYKTKPRTAQRKLNAEIWEAVSDLMLNITDLENYDAIDFLRNTYGIEYARENGFNPNNLHEKLLADKQLFAKLETAKEKDPGSVGKIYREAGQLMEQLHSHQIPEKVFTRKISATKLLGEALFLLLLFPLFLVGFIPHIPVYAAPRPIVSKLKDPMFKTSIELGLSALITVPAIYILAFMIIGILTHTWIYALLCLILLPFLGIFAFRYIKTGQLWINKIRFYRLLKNGTLYDMTNLKTEINEIIVDC